MKKFRLISLLFSLAVAYILLTSHSIGQATGYNEDDTGAPTAQLCTSCHGGGSYGPVTTTIQVFTHGTTTAISSYQPGTLYDVQVTVKPGAGTPGGYGFEFTGLTTPGNTPISGYSNLASNVKQKTLTTGTWSGRTFTEHNGVTSNNVFAFSWTAPAAGTGAIEFYASGNAVNGDGTDRGDNPSNTSLVVPETLGVSATTTNVSCFDGDNGAITLTTIGGTSPYNYNWGSGVTSQNRTGLAAGTYTVTVTDNAGNTVSEPFTISQPSAALNITAMPTNVLCYGGSTGALNITVTGGTASYTYNWGGGITSQNRSSLAAGSYTVTVTDKNSCTASNSFTITQPSAALSLPATTTGVSCFGGDNGAIQLNPTGGTGPYSYKWAGNITTENRDSLASGTYSVTVKDNNGCTDTSSYTVSQPAKLIITDTLGSIVCFGGTTSIKINASGGTSPYTGTGSFTLQAGTYNYTVTDANGCASSTSANIPQPSMLIATASTITISCGGDSGAITVSATGGTPPYTGTGNFTVTSPGSYTYTVTDSNGCSSNATGTALASSGLTDSFAIAAPACHNSCNGSVSVFVSGGAPPYSFLWSDSTNGQNDTALCAGNYQQTITDTTGCSLINNYIVPQVSAIEIGITSDSIYCFGDSSQVLVNVSGGVGSYTYRWSSGQVQANIETPAGSYSLSVTDNHQCVASDSLTINQPAKLSVAGVTTNTPCFAFDGGKITTTITGGVLPYKFIWNNDSIGMNITALPAGEYTLTVTDHNACTATSSFNVTQPDSLSINVVSIANDTGNNSGAIAVSASGGTPPYNYSWGEFTFDSAISHLGPGTYTVYVIDSNGCSATLNIAIIATGITNLQLGQIKLYPNPATDEVFVHIPVLNTLVQIQIFSIEGKLMKGGILTGADNRVDVSGLPPALYLFEIGAGNELVKFKVSKAE